MAPLPGNSVAAFFKTVALLFGAAAVFHAWSIVSPATGDPSGALRHGIFVGINLLVAVGLWWQPARLRLIFGLLVLQQLSTHGASAWRAWFEHHELDYVSLGIMVLLPVTWAILWRSRD